MLKKVIANFEAATGAVVKHSCSQSSEQQIVIDIKAGSPSNISVFPQPGLAANMAAIGGLVPLGDKTRDWVKKNYAAGSSWADLGTYSSKAGKKEFYGFFYNVNVKSLVWYIPENFKEKGYKVPKSMEELQDLTKKMAADGEFLEWAHVFGHRYGTPKGPVEEKLAAGCDVLFDIDWQGAQQLYQEAGPDVVRVFILPPSIDELERRLHSRAQDSDAVIADRMSRAKAEIGHWDGYDYVLINDDVQACFEKIQQILAAERMKRRRQKGLIGFVRDLAAT